MSSPLSTVDSGRLYNDGPDLPTTPMLLAAERAYREAFLAGAREAARWDYPDTDELDTAWELRRRVRRQAEVVMSSAEYFDDPSFDEYEVPGQQVAYRPGHEVEASRARGRGQALEIATQFWNELYAKGPCPDLIAPLVLIDWSKLVEEWAASDMDRLVAPPRPEECLTEEKKRILDAYRPDPEEEEHVKPEKRKVQPRFRCVADLLLDHPVLRPSVVEGLLREGEVMNVIASPKTGKSWLATDIAIAVATGQPWLDSFPTQRGQALLLDNELHGETLASRIPKVAEARGIPVTAFGREVFVETMRGNLVDIFELEGYFYGVEPGRFSLIVLDAFYRFMPRDMDENDNGTVAAIYNRLDSYAQRLRCSFICIHHSSKGLQSEKAVTDVGAGAGAQSRAADAHLIIRPHAQDGVVVLDAAVRSWPPMEPRCLRWAFPVFEPADHLDPRDLKRPASRRARPEESNQPAQAVWTPERFFEAIRFTEPQGKADVQLRAASLGMSGRQANELLRQAEGLGLVVRRSSGANRPVTFIAN